MQDPFSWAFPLGRFFGIPVRVHVVFPLVAAGLILRVAYPLGFFAKGMDGRVDDPKAGWKGKGVWTTWGTRTPFHSETGKGTTSKVVHFQLRPNPLAD